jgi:Domain of unknown function (DUF4124)
MAGLGLSLGSGTAAADFYRWVDAKGVVNYSNIPPQGVKATQIPDTQPTVSIIPRPERQAESMQAAHDAELLRRIEQLEDELAAMRRASVPSAIYTYPVPDIGAMYSTSIASPTWVFPFPVFVPRVGHGFKGPRSGFGWGRSAGSMPPGPAPHGGRSGVSVRGRF